MQALYYAVPEDRNGSKIRRNIEEAMPEAHIECHTTVSSLKDRLLHGFDKKTVAVVSIASEEDLIDTYFIQHLLSKVFLIVLLPDRTPHSCDGAPAPSLLYMLRR